LRELRTLTFTENSRMNARRERSPAFRMMFGGGDQEGGGLLRYFYLVGWESFDVEIENCSGILLVDATSSSLLANSLSCYFEDSR